ncbi:MAG: deoxyribodipyrimidine photo-lyase, partial [Gammaproteobacteria bacterium]
MNIFWFRRDLRLDDNAALYQALQAGSVWPVFILDADILDQLQDKQDKRVSFIYRRLRELKHALEQQGSTLHVFHGRPAQVFQTLLAEHDIAQVYAGKDYEPYAQERDARVAALLSEHNAELVLVKDHVIFEEAEIVKADGSPYIVYTPYMRAWKKRFLANDLQGFASEDLASGFSQLAPARLLPLKDCGFTEVDDGVPEPVLDPDILAGYHKNRDYPAQDATSHLGPHLRFGTVSVRNMVAMAVDLNEVWWNQLIWREFFLQILYHFPHTATRSFRPEYDAIRWRNNQQEFAQWCEGKTGFPMVDAGMRQLNATGYMHNRVRMITANFLTKLLLIDWRWGERYFAEKLLDYEMANNVGGWQWSAGCGCDAAPYFRIFNPDTQVKKFDPELAYIRHWLPEYGTADYPLPMVDYRMARERALAVYKSGLQEGKQSE